MLELRLLVTAVVHHLEGAGGRLPGGKWRGKPRMRIWFATHEHVGANSAQHLCTEILPCRDADRSLPFPGYSFTRVFSCVSVCMMTVSFSWVLSLAWSSWIGPTWNSKWTSEAAPSGNHSHGLGLSKQWELRVCSCRRTFRSCSRTVFAHTPDSRTCPLNYSSVSVIVLLVLPGARTQPEHQHHFRFQLFLHVVSLAALVETVACFTQILVFFFYQAETTPFPQLAWQTTTVS